MYISKRFCDVISRWLLVNWDYILKNGNNYKNIHRPIISITYKDMMIEITSSSSHKDYCIGYECNCLVLQYMLCISQLTDSLLLDHITFDDTSDVNDVVSELSSRMGTTYKICICGGDVACMYELCKTCYIYQYTRPEDEGGSCCICLENIGTWVKLPCDHYIHTHCCYRMIMNTCPLCRSPFHTYDIIRNPYDV